MALHLKKSMVWGAAINSGVCVAIAIGIASMSGAAGAEVGAPLWLAALGAVVALLSFRRAAARVRRATLAPLQRMASYVRIERDSPLARQQVDWSVIDDYAAQLLLRGYRALGDFTAYPMAEALAGVAALFSDADGTTMIEIQQLKLLPAAGPERMRDGIYFSITSMVGGSIRVVTCNHPAQASTYLMRGDHDVLSTHPGQGLLALLVQHTDMLMRLRQKIGKPAAKGLTVERYVLTIREAQMQAARRLAAMGGFAIAGVVDEFEARSLSRWAPSSAALKAVPERLLEAMDGGFGADRQPPVFHESLADQA